MGTLTELPISADSNGPASPAKDQPKVTKKGERKQLPGTFVE
jgi:hypothetical protein